MKGRGGNAHFEHVFGVLRWTTIDRERILLGVDRPPFGHVQLVGCFDLPVLDQILDQCLEGFGFMFRAPFC